MRRGFCIAMVLCMVMALAVWSLPGSAIAQQPTATVEGGAATSFDPRADANETMNMAFTWSLLNVPNAGPLSADLQFGPLDDRILDSGVNLSDFYARATFVTPANEPAGAWGIGIQFWVQGDDTYYEFFVRSVDGAPSWSLMQATADDFPILQQGDLAPGAIDLTPGAASAIDVVVAQGFAILAGNDNAVISTIDLGDAVVSGDVRAHAGFLADDPTTTQALNFSISDFSVWDLSPVVGGVVAGAGELPANVQPTQAPVQPAQAPAQPSVAASAGSSPVLQQAFDRIRSLAMANAPAASLPPGTLQQANSAASIELAGVSLENVYVTATFFNPDDLSTGTDMVIGFRVPDSNAELRFVVTTDGIWGLAIGDAAPLAQGTVANFDPAPGASNTLEVIAGGATGLLAVNGVAIQRVDLSGNLNAGDVYIGTGLYTAYLVDGRQIGYSNAAVYQLPG